MRKPRKGTKYIWLGVRPYYRRQLKRVGFVVYCYVPVQTTHPPEAAREAMGRLTFETRGQAAEFKSGHTYAVEQVWS